MPGIVARCWPTSAKTYLSPSPFLLWQSPGPYFSCQSTSRPGVSQLAFLNHRPQPESHRALSIRSTLSARRSPTLSPCAKTAKPHMHVKFPTHGRATGGNTKTRAGGRAHTRKLQTPCVALAGCYWLTMKVPTV